MPLPEDRGRRGDSRPNVHRFRSHLVELGRRLRAFRARYGLTQAEVIRLLAAGASDAEIARRLVISVRTANRHVANILSKTGAPNRTAAAALVLGRSIEFN